MSPAVSPGARIGMGLHGATGLGYTPGRARFVPIDEEATPSDRRRKGRKPLGREGRPEGAPADAARD